MHRALGRHMRHNVVAYIALFFAMGGTGAYAANEWTGANIKDETLTGADVKGKPATSSSSLVEGTLTGNDVRGSSGVDGSITSLDIKNGSLLKGDFKAGQLPAGPQGPTGEQGPQGPAGGVLGRVIVAHSTALPAFSNADIEVVCPSGKVVIGGGASTYRYNPITFSAPDPSSEMWLAKAHNGGPANDALTAWGVCANAE